MDYITIMNLNDFGKRDGFSGEKLILVPPSIIAEMDDGLTPLVITDIGHFPRAFNHGVIREEPIISWVLIHCREGSGRVQGKGVNKGDTVLLPPGIAHSYSSDDWEIVWVHFLAPPALGSAIEKRVAITGGEWSGVAEKHFFSILATLAEGMSLDHCRQASMNLFAFFSEFLFAQPEDPQRDIIGKCREYIHANLSSPISLGELSNLVKRTPHYLCALYKQKTGHTPIDDCIRIKIQNCCDQLDHSSLKIKEIAFSLGYGDPYYFSRLFKKIMGCSPSQYRKRLK